MRSLESPGAEDTRARILDVSEELFAERGVNGTSLRAITAEAGANVAAVNYHFGGKAKLLEAVVDRAFGRVLDEQLRLLDGLESDEFTVPVIVRAMTAPFVGMSGEDQARFRVVSHLIGRLMIAKDPEIRRMVAAQTREVEDRYVAALGRALPEVEEDELRWRCRSASFLISQDLTDPFADYDSAEDYEERRERLVAFLTAALDAPTGKSNPP